MPSDINFRRTHSHQLPRPYSWSYIWQQWNLTKIKVEKPDLMDYFGV